MNVGTRIVVRSGEFIAGNFALYRRHWDGTINNSKLYYIPLFPPNYIPDATPLPTITARRLDAPAGQIAPAQFLGPAWTYPDGAFFYASGTVLPERGRWRLTATLGKNRGCFDLAL